ncbi:MAG: O-antigen ligase family protein [Patescibacteria group bacterium]|nr:O-antigen ligase family protein [Patescibacteria group bacterium]
MTRKILNYLTGIIFLMPFTLLIVDTSVLFPYITTKAIIFRILVTIGFVLALWLYLINPGSFPKKNFMLIAIVFFLLANILSTIFSITPYRSFWGNAERMEGLWSLFFYLGYLFLLITLFQFAPEKKKTIFISIAIVSVIISAVQINQAFFDGIVRPSATLGNATYVGFLSLLVIFLTLFFLSTAKSFPEKLIYFGLIGMNLISLLASQTRGSILGLLVGAFFGSLLYLILNRWSLKIKLAVLGGLVILIFGFYFFLKTDLAYQIPGFNRLADTLKNPVSVFPRLFAWKIFLDAFKERPIFGWGQESLPVAFFAHFNPELYLYERAIFDRPHNKFVEMLVSNGIVGFIAWLSIFIAFVYYLLKQNISIFQKSVLFGLLFAYLGQNFSLFDMQASYLVFLFALSLVTPKVEIKEDRGRFIRPYLVLASGVALVLIVIHLQHYYVVRNIISALRGVNPQTNLHDTRYATSEFKRLSNIAGPFLTEEAIMIANYLTNNAGKIDNFGDFIALFEVIEKAYQKDRYDYRLTNIYLGNLYILTAIEKQFGQDSRPTIAKIDSIYRELISQYPLVPETYIQYALFWSNLGDKQKALMILEEGERKIASLYPKYLLQQATALINLGENSLAYKKVQKFKETNIHNLTSDDYQILLETYSANNDVENSKSLISQWLKIDNSSSTKKLIREILSKYGQAKIYNLDI